MVARFRPTTGLVPLKPWTTKEARRRGSVEPSAERVDELRRDDCPPPASGPVKSLPGRVSQSTIPLPSLCPRIPTVTPPAAGLPCFRDRRMSLTYAQGHATERPTPQYGARAICDPQTLHSDSLRAA